MIKHILNINIGHGFGHALLPFLPDRSLPPGAISHNRFRKFSLFTKRAQHFVKLLTLRADRNRGCLDQIVIRRRIIGLHTEVQIPRRQLADRGQHRIGSDHHVGIGRDKVRLRVEQVLLGIEHVQGGTCAQLGLFASAFERDLRGAHPVTETRS